MKYYLSSYQLGDQKEWLRTQSKLFPRLGFIPNALDFTNVDKQKYDQVVREGIAELESMGFIVELLDLKDYFNKPQALQNKINSLQGLWVRGGNVFVLRQAMYLSRLDTLLAKLSQRDNFLYAGFSAGVCVLASDLRAFQLVDDATDTPYPKCKQVIFSGIGLLDYAILPHYDSEHPESKDIEKCIKFCIKEKILFKALRDGEVLIL